MPKFSVHHHVLHNGVMHRRGSTIELAPEAAIPLLASGHIGPHTIGPGTLLSVLSNATLAKLTKQELLTHAAATGVQVDDTADKEALLASFAAHLDALKTKGVDPAKE